MGREYSVGAGAIQCEVMAALQTSVIEPHDHVVNLYDADEHMVADLARYVAEGLAVGDAVIVIATGAHRDVLTAGVGEYGIDVGAVSESGQYQLLDATETMSWFMVDGTPDPDRFRTSIGNLIGQAAVGRRSVRVFGEIVAVLWEQGNVTAAIDVERLWNHLATDHHFSLYCAYPIASLGSDLDTVRQVCSHHSSVITPASYLDGISRSDIATPTEERSRMFVPVPLAVRAARRFVTGQLARSNSQTLVEDAGLVISELATNAVMHGASPFRVSIAQSDSIVRLTVEDTSGEPLSRPEPMPAAIGGRGLAVIDSLCARWGVEPHDGGKAVWAELAV